MRPCSEAGICAEGVLDWRGVGRLLVGRGLGGDDKADVGWGKTERKWAEGLFGFGVIWSCVLSFLSRWRRFDGLIWFTMKTTMGE